MKIAIDIDDTLTKVDRVTYTQQYIKENNLNFKLLNPDAHAISEIFDWTYEDAFNFVRAGGAVIFTHAPARGGAKETIEKWKAAGHHITILTARSQDWFQDPEGLSKAQLERNQIPYDDIVAGVYEKGMYCKEHGIQILIEDNFDICKTAQELGIRAVMFLDKHNLEHKDEIAFTASSWEEAAEVVDSILNQKA